jgi:hypothetical protein
VGDLDRRVTCRHFTKCVEHWRIRDVEGTPRLSRRTETEGKKAGPPRLVDAGLQKYLRLNFIKSISLQQADGGAIALYHRDVFVH